MAKILETLGESLKSRFGKKSTGQGPSQEKKATPQSDSSIYLKIIGKNFMSIHGMARDLNVARQNIQKLVKLEGGEPSKGADAHFLKEAEKESKLEVEVEKAAPKAAPTPAKPKKEKSFFERMKEMFSPGKILKSLLAVLAIGSIVAVLWESFKESFVEWTEGLWETIKEKFGEFVENIKIWFKETIEPLITKVKDFFQEWVIDPISKFFTKVGDFFVGFFQFWSNLITSPIETVKGLWEKFKELIDVAVQKIADTYVNLSSPLRKAADFFLPKTVQEELTARGKKEPEKKPLTAEESAAAAEAAAAAAPMSPEEMAAQAALPEAPAPAPAPTPPAPPPPPPPPAAAPAAPTPAAKPAEVPKVPPTTTPSAAPPTKPAKPSEGKPGKISSETGKKAMIGAMDDAKIVDPNARAAIMAQVGHESGGFTTLSENLNYKAATLMKLFPKKFKGPEDAQQVSAGGPKSVAERLYGGRMGNAPEGGGEGFEYRGRGFVQLTGKQNYTKFGYSNNPEELTKPEGAAESAIKYMMGYKGDWTDIKKVTKFVNGGYIGLEDRAKHFQEYLNDPKITQIGAVSTATSGGSVASASGSVASGQRQQMKPGTPIVVNAPTTNNTVVAQNNPPPTERKNTSAALAARVA